MNIKLEKLAKIIAKKNLYLTFDYEDSPAELYGGNWERVAENLTLWTTITQGESGNIVAAGLPNIIGNLIVKETSWATQNVSAESGGAFTRTIGGYEKTYTVAHDDTQFGADKINFNANNGASVKGIYGNSSTVQPPAIKVYLWRKVS